VISVINSEGLSLTLCPLHIAVHDKLFPLHTKKLLFCTWVNCFVPGCFSLDKLVPHLSPLSTGKVLRWGLAFRKPRTGVEFLAPPGIRTTISRLSGHQPSYYTAYAVHSNIKELRTLKKGPLRYLNLSLVALIHTGFDEWFCKFSIFGRKANFNPLVEEMCLEPEGCAFDSRWGHGDFYLLNPSDNTMILGSTQSLTEMSTRDPQWGGGG
jgi:hypothetical protein